MENEKKNYSMTQILGSTAIQTLGTNLNLTNEQIAKAKSTALRLSADANLKNCDKMSLVRYCFETARYNFSREDCIYPVPYGNSVQAQVGYKGFIEIAYRTGKYQRIDSSIVLSCDKVVRDRETGLPNVEFETDYKKTIGATVIGYFAFATDKQGKIVNTIFMSVEEMEAHGKQFSKTYNKTWKENFNAMARKTVLKKLCGRLDNSSAVLDALRQTDQIVFTPNGKDYLDNPNNDGSKRVIDTMEDEDFVVPNNSISENQ